ncbi:MAG: lysozyme inhibitor LprI family protein, partial [Nitrosomonas ureae]
MKKLIAISVLFFSVSSFGASFDCTKAGTSTEQSICDSSELSSLDEAMAQIYRSKIASSSELSQLKSDQRSWITEIRNKCADTNCLTAVYKNRIIELQSTPSASTSEQVAASSFLPAPTELTSAKIATTEALTTPSLPQNTDQTQISSSTTVTLQTPPSAEVESMPQKAEVTTIPEISKTHELSSLQWKLIGLAFLVNALATIYLHKSDKLVIYQNYTDAAITGLAPLIAIIVYYVLRFFEIQPENAQISAALVFVGLMYFVAKATHRNNNGLSVFFVMSLITKITIVGVYYAIMAALIFGSGSSRRKGERLDSFEARKRREAKANAAAMAATTVGFVALSAWVCKESEFVSLAEYLSP